MRSRVPSRPHLGTYWTLAIDAPVVLQLLTSHPTHHQPIIANGHVVPKREILKSALLNPPL